MKSDKRGIYFILLLILSLTIISAATSQETGISVTVASTPSLEITSPTATTYTEGDYILLDWTENLIDTIWYNLDNTTNTTINTSFYFQTSVGTHNLYLFGNLSNGTIFSDQVTFSVQSAPSGGGRGRGRAEVPIEEGVIEEKIPFTIQQGETKELKLLIKNELNKESKIRIEDLSLENLLTKISDIEFYLNPDESKEITLTFYANKNKAPELYIEKILITTEDYEKEVSIYIEVESLDFLFDVRVDIPEEPEIFSPGEELSAIIDFYNLGKQEEAEVNIEYLIKNEEGNIIFGEKQNLIIGTSISITKRLDLPENIEEGDYVFYVKAKYDSKTASASKWFKIEKHLMISNFLNTLKQEAGKDREKIAVAIAVLIGLYVILTPLEILFGKRGKYHLIKRRYIKRKVIKKRSKIKAAKKRKILKHYYGSKRISAKKARKLMKKKK